MAGPISSQDGGTLDRNDPRSIIDQSPMTIAQVIVVAIHQHAVDHRVTLLRIAKDVHRVDDMKVWIVQRFRDAGDRLPITRLSLLGPGPRHGASNLGRANPALERTCMQATLRQEVQFGNLQDEHHFAIPFEQLLQVTAQ